MAKVLGTFYTGTLGKAGTAPTSPPDLTGVQPYPINPPGSGGGTPFFGVGDGLSLDSLYRVQLGSSPYPLSLIGSYVNLNDFKGTNETIFGFGGEFENAAFITSLLDLYNQYSDLSTYYGSDFSRSSISQKKDLSSIYRARVNVSSIINADSSGQALAMLSAQNSSGTLVITLDSESGGIVSDTIRNKGLENASDYEANFTARSLVTKQYVTAAISGGITGSGTVNQIAYFTGASVIASLPVSTYPSLTELSYMKGVTSAVQTQINAKQATIAGTLTNTYVATIVAGVPTWAVASGGGGSTNAFAETPSGLVNSVNLAYTLANTPADTDGVLVLLNGVTQYNGVDYSVSGATITFTVAPVTGSSIFAYYNTFTASGGVITRSITSASVNTTAGGTASTDYVYFVTGTTTITLPTAVGNTNRYTIKSVSGVTTVACNGVQTIDGTTTIGIAVEDSVDLISNNTEWKVV